MPVSKIYVVQKSGTVSTIGGRGRMVSGSDTRWTWPNGIATISGLTQGNIFDQAYAALLNPTYYRYAAGDGSYGSQAYYAWKTNNISLPGMDVIYTAETSPSSGASAYQDTALTVLAGKITAYGSDASPYIQIKYKHVSTLNSIPASEDGAMWIWTDRCMAVRPSDHGANTQRTLPADSTAAYDWEYTHNPWGGGVEVYDTCPTCKSCTAVMTLKRRAEWIKMMLNMFKDVNINLGLSSAGGDSIYALRQQYLASNRISIPDNCSIDADQKYASIPDMKGSPLMNEYIATVHMWNFVVSRNNTSVEIAPATESTSGFVVNTKHALTSCDGQLKLSCKIHVKPDPNTANAVEPDISVLVTGLETQFAPFNVAASVSGVYGNEASKTLSLVTEKEITANFNPATVAGTYILTAKFIPFVNSRLVDDDEHEISLDSIVWSPAVSVTTSTTSDGSTVTTYKTSTVLIGASATSITELPDPTQRQYNEAGRFPSKMGQGFNRWQITVTWTIYKNAGDSTWALFKSYTSTYLFETIRTRRPVDGLLQDAVWTTSEVSSEV